MANLNKVMLQGRITKDVELKHTAGAEPKAYAMFSLAVNRAKKDEVDFINCKAWGKTAELISTWFKKGAECIVEGRLEVNSVNTDGVTKTFTNVVVGSIYFTGGSRVAPPTMAKEEGPKSVPMDEEEDLPF